MGKCIWDGDDNGGGLVWFLCSNTYKFSCFSMFPLFSTTTLEICMRDRIFPFFVTKNVQNTSRIILRKSFC